MDETEKAANGRAEGNNLTTATEAGKQETGNRENQEGSAGMPAPLQRASSNFLKRNWRRPRLRETRSPAWARA